MIMAINVETDSHGRLIMEKPLHEKTCLSLFEAWLHKVKIGVRRGSIILPNSELDAYASLCTAI